MYEETTIAAIATSPGEGGIGIIRISGMQAADVADRVFHTKKIKSFHEAEPYACISAVSWKGIDRWTRGSPST